MTMNGTGMFLLSQSHQNGFTDGNRKGVEPLDVVEYRFGARRGILIEALQDGEAFVLFRDTRAVEIVKWCHLARVPEADGPGARERRNAFPANGSSAKPMVEIAVDELEALREQAWKYTELCK